MDFGITVELSHFSCYSAWGLPGLNFSGKIINTVVLVW